MRRLSDNTLKYITIIPKDKFSKKKSINGFFPSDNAKDEYWKSYVRGVEDHERSLITELKEVFATTERDVLSQVKDGKKPRVDQSQIAADYKAKAAPVLAECMNEAIKNGQNLVAPENPHKSTPPPPNPSQSGAAWLVTRIEWAANQIGETLAQDLADSMDEGLSNGESTDELANRIADFFGGTNGIDRNQRIARTETMMASNYGASQGYKSMGVTQLEWKTSLDERTCQDCEDMDGDIEDIDDFPLPPQSSHPNCRCVAYPVKE